MRMYMPCEWSAGMHRYVFSNELCKCNVRRHRRVRLSRCRDFTVAGFFIFSIFPSINIPGDAAQRNMEVQLQNMRTHKMQSNEGVMQYYLAGRAQ